MIFPKIFLKSSPRCVRLHYPPTWLQLRAPLISSLGFCRSPPAPLISTLISHLTSWQTTFGSLPASDPLPRKQSFSDRPGILASRAVVESSISDSVQMATFLAASAPHSGDWFLALPVSSCGIKLDDDAVRVAVSLRLGCSICVAHTCRCDAMVDVQQNSQA